MKSIFLIALFTSTTAFACPDLTGAWNCQSPNGDPTASTVQQQDIPGGVLYTATTDDGTVSKIYADGTAHPVNDNGMTGTMTATCSGDSIVSKEHLEGQGSIVDIDLNLSRQDVNTFSESGSLVYTTSDNPQPQTQPFTATCTKH